MRAAPVILAGALVAATAPRWTPGWAQVTTDPSALDALRKPGAQPAPQRRTPPRPATHPATRPVKPEAARRPDPAPTTAGPAPSPSGNAAEPNRSQTPAVASKPPPTPAQKPRMPETPPAILNLPPPIAVPTARPLPIPDAPVAVDAKGTASPLTNGVRLTFAPESATFNPATEAVLRDFARSQLDSGSTRITIYAYASGNPEDPSTPRRIALQRALAARAVLMKNGIPSPRIYPRALGPAGGSVDPDRVDVIAGPPQAQGAASG